jgi:heavy metal sensor kinase
LRVAVYDTDKKQLLLFNHLKEQAPESVSYPEEVGAFNYDYHWVKWNYWRIDFYYRGKACFIKMNLLQRLEIQEDITTFFLGALAVSIILSVLAGKIITYHILKRAQRIENAAAMIAAGKLSCRIPESDSNDEVGIIENNLNKAFSDLEKSFNAVMEFSSDIAHELRTPLTVITGEIEVALRESRTPEEYQEVMVKVLEEIMLLRKIIDDMLILVKPDSAYRIETFESLDISEILADTIVFFHVIAESKSITLKNDIEKDIIIKASPPFIRLIFSNLLNNAIKYTQSGGKIDVVLKRKKDKVVFSVSDNGPGIPEDEQKKIFSRFYRVDKKNESGLGLGLAIVKKACRIHNAGINLESSPGQGSCFIVEFQLP